MTDLRVLAGYSPDDRGDDALALASLIVRTAGAHLTVANVHPSAWPARGPGSVDAEWVAYLKEQSELALAQAADRLAKAKLPDKDVAYVVRANRGSGRGLLEVAKKTDAGLIVIGSAPRGRRGRIAIGSTADQLLHGSPVPVMLAPRGYAEEAPQEFERLTVAYWRRPATEAALAAAARLARSLGLPVRLVTLVLRPPGLAAKFQNAEEVMRRQFARAEEDLAHAAELVGAEVRVSTEAIMGAGIAKTLGALDVRPGEILACMSSHDGPLRKVFLGESSGKIVRAACRPVVVLPRGAPAGA
ncbi:universal stress protein [Spirillospora sp. NPDC048911]|uniref:universal stress protein n=1 Tax=Spirillospora sp. NPDC048911 TaxID=3364527 RepID=UPI00371E52FE